MTQGFVKILKRQILAYCDGTVHGMLGDDMAKREWNYFVG